MYATVRSTGARVTTRTEKRVDGQPQVVAKSPAFHTDVGARMRHWLGGYVRAEALDRDDYVVAPMLGDRAGIAGGMALAHDLLDRMRVAGN